MVASRARLAHRVADRIAGRGMACVWGHHICTREMSCMAHPCVPYHLDYMVLQDYFSVCLYLVYPVVVHHGVVHHGVVHLAEPVAYLYQKLEV